MFGIKLDLMDWKTLERVTDAELRRAMVEVIIHRKSLEIAKTQIKSYGGKTIEEEIAEVKKAAEKGTSTG